MTEEATQEFITWVQDVAEEIIRDILDDENETDPTDLAWDNTIDAAADQIEANTFMSEHFGIHAEIIWRLIEGEIYTILHHGFQNETESTRSEDLLG